MYMYSADVCMHSLYVNMHVLVYNKCIYGNVSIDSVYVTEKRILSLVYRKVMDILYQEGGNICGSFLLIISSTVSNTTFEECP